MVLMEIAIYIIKHGIIILHYYIMLKKYVKKLIISNIILKPISYNEIGFNITN